MTAATPPDSTSSVTPQDRDCGTGLFQTLFQCHQAVMLLLDPESLDVLDANAAALEFYGWKLETMRSMNFRQICQDGPACHIQVIEQCHNHGGRVAICRHLVAEGSVRDVDIRISRIQVDDRSVLFAVISDITARMVAERALKESEARLRSLYENTREGMFQSTPEGRFLFVNPACARIFGYASPEEMTAHIGDIASQIYDEPADRAAILDDLKRTGVADWREFKARKRDGSNIWIRMSLWEVRDASGGEARLEGVLEDITDRRQAEHALRESEARLRGICENSKEGLFQGDMAGRFLWVNSAFARMLGYKSPEDLVASVTDAAAQVWVSTEERAKVLESIHKRGFLERQEVRLKRRDGRTIWVAANTWIVRDQDGRPVRYEGVVEDITARKQTESERMLLATAVEQAVEGVVIATGSTWHVEYANPAFGRIVGLDRPAILGADFFSLFEDGRQLLPVRDIQQALREGHEWTGPVRDSRPGGRQLSVEAIFSPIRDEAGRVTNVVVLLRDVGYQDRLEKRLRRAHKLEAVGTLAGGIAHDFNNILTPILLNAEVGMQLLEPGDILRRPLEEIIQAGGRARRLIRQILAFSRRGDLRASRMELEPLVREAVRLLRANLPPDVEVRLEVDGGAVEIMADPGLVHQMVSNLADNALHAMQERGGTLTIRLGKRTLEPGEHTGSYPLPPGEYATLAVADTGHGMDQTLLERIFIPFFTTKRPGEGTGMGLATVHGVVRSLGGGVRVESELGKGSLFEIYLPLAGPLSVSVPIPAGRERRALVVDAQAFSRRALAMTLGELGFKVTMMRDAAKALKTFAKVSDRFDAVLAGEDLHGMSGRGFLKSCSEVGGKAILVLLADRDESEDVMGVADAVLRKPVNSADLLRVLTPGQNAAKPASPETAGGKADPPPLSRERPATSSTD